jgi:ribosomal protein L18E
MPIYRRVPKRGFTNARFRTDYTVINVELLNSFDDGATVDLAAVIAHGLASRVTPLFKVLGNGDLSKKLVVRAQKFSKSAAEKIKSAGGSVVELDERGGVKPEPPPPAPGEAEKSARGKASGAAKAAPGAKQPKAKGADGGKKGDAKPADAKKGDAKAADGAPKKKADAKPKPDANPNPEGGPSGS